MTTYKFILLTALLGLPILSNAATVNFSGVNPLDQEVTGTASDFFFNTSNPNRGKGGYTNGAGKTETATFDNQNNTGLQGEPTGAGGVWTIKVNPGEILDLSFLGTVSDFYRWGDRSSQTRGRGDFSIAVSGDPLPAPVRDTSAVFNDPNTGGLESRLFTDQYSWANIPSGTYTFQVTAHAIKEYTVSSHVSLINPALLCLFNWAERKYPEFLNPPTTVTQVLFPYTYRYYKNTRVYVGVSEEDHHVHYLPLGGVIQDLEDLTAWLKKSGCDK